MEEPQTIIDAEYRVVRGPRDRWQPFKSWLFPKLLTIAAWLVFFVVGTAVLVTVRSCSGYYLPTQL